MKGFGFESSVVGGGSGIKINSVTYSELMSLISSNGLVAGEYYKITDRGDRWIMLQALSNNKLSETGYRLMLCPKDYNPSGNWRGIWRPGLTVSIGDYVIYGALVWKNLTGNIGTNIDYITLDSTNWELIPKSSFENGEYIEILFECIYSLEYDCVVKQWDDKGNIITYNPSPIWPDDINGCDHTDWNNEYVFGNINKGVINNIVRVFNNNNNGYILNNFAIYAGGAINFNKNNGNINDNLVGQIYYNENNGDIYNNSGGEDSLIYNNKNNGSIYDNINITDISYNENDGEIFNNNVSNINYNINIGDISNNNCSYISYNSNLGEIDTNNNTGWGIQNNSNLGFILLNSNNGDIYLNSNAGNINGNTNAGNIELNNNNGSISDCSNIGNINNNKNNGYIIYCFSSTNCNVENNENNGNITGRYSSNVSDPIVNKEGDI